MIPFGGEVSSRRGKIFKIPTEKGVTDFPLSGTGGKKCHFPCRKFFPCKSVERRTSFFPGICPGEAFANDESRERNEVEQPDSPRRFIRSFRCAVFSAGIPIGLQRYRLRCTMDSMSRYINPYTDFGFKKLFGEEASNFTKKLYTRLICYFKIGLVHRPLPNPLSEGEGTAFCRNDKNDHFHAV